MKNKKVLLIIPVAAVVMIGLIIGAIFLLTRGKNEIYAKWVSDVYHHSKYDCDVKNTLVILPDGSTVVTVVRAEANIVLDTKYGYSEVSNFKVKFTTPSEDGTTIYHYNPITNRIKSGIRTYKHVKIKNTAPKISEELMDAIEGQWGYIGVKSEDINFQEDEVNVYVFNRDGSGQMVSYNKFGTEQWISTYDGCYTVDEKNSTIEFKFDIYGEGEMETRYLTYSLDGEEPTMQFTQFSSPKPTMYKADWEAIGAEIKKNDMQEAEIAEKYGKYIRRK